MTEDGTLMPGNSIPIPDGTATFRDPKKITANGRRAMQVLVLGLGPERAQAIFAAGTDPAKTAALRLTASEREIMLSFPDASIFALLKSWTLPEPLPECLADVGRLEVDLWDPLAAEAVRLAAEHAATLIKDGQYVDPFSVGAVEDRDSPTGASAASQTRSAAEAAPRRAPSDRKRPGGTRRTGTGKRSRD